MGMKFLSGFLCFFTGGFLSGHINAQSLAHKRSSFAIIDPAYNAHQPAPKDQVNKDATWLYGLGELECYRLELLQKRKDEAKLNVGYTGDFHTPYKKGVFSLKLDKPLIHSELRFKAVGKGVVFVNNKRIAAFDNARNMHIIQLRSNTPIKDLRISLEVPEGIPTLLPLDLDGVPNLNWQWQGPEGEPETAKQYKSDSITAPHLLEDPSVRLSALNVLPNTLDFGRELIGHIYVKANEEPSIGVGESEPEALAKDHKEQSNELVRVKPGVWRTKTPVAFRFVGVNNGHVDSIWAEAIFHPETYKGAFACSDSLLTRIWMNAAYTLRLCMQDFLLDGIKRDRLPWAGDLAMSSLVDAYSFGDGALIEKTLVAIGRAGVENKDINGIVDFSLWWLIAHDQYQKYFDNKDFLKSQWPLIQSILTVLARQVDEEGFLVPRKGTRLFVDWVKQEKWATLQVMWWWAEKAACQLALRAGDYHSADYWKALQTKTKASIDKELWNSKGGYFYAKDSLSQLTRHQNFLAIVAGLVEELGQKQSIQKYLLSSLAMPVGTPYMKGFEMMGLGQSGNMTAMINEVKAYWGGMIEKGATSFWEAYTPSEQGAAMYRFYNRPFGKSLCHAWSAGPAAFLPEEILGIKPLSDGWKRFEVRPNLGSLSWATATVPTIYGDIQVFADNHKVKIHIPKGAALVWEEKTISGPLDYESGR